MRSRNTRPISWIKAARKVFESFPRGAQDEIMTALTIAAEGEKADIAKPLKGLGSGVFEIALKHRSDAYRTAEELMDFITPRGSIAIDGVSLTVAELGKSFFEVALIPATLERTTLGRLGAMATPVNLETDCLVKAVVHYLSRREC